MISVKKAERFVLEKTKRAGTEKVPLQLSLNRVLRQTITADRDYPPFNRATMDGIAICHKDFSKNNKEFTIKAILAAGQKPVEIKESNECVQIMTGACVPGSLDTVVPIEDLKIDNCRATVKSDTITKGQFVHLKGSDRKRGEIIINPGKVITSEILPILASIGATSVLVSKHPRIVVVTTGDELVDVELTPSEYQIRRSNDYAIWATLKKYGIEAIKIHLKDDKEILKKEIKKYCNYDAVLISGGVSKGNFDYVQIALEEIGVKKLFHGINQKPGKPMWFGVHPKGARFFALPGNPVSSYLCLHRYFLPWLESSLEITDTTEMFAALDKSTSSSSELTFFTQAHIYSDSSGRLFAKTVSHNGSGDFMSLENANAFIELPAKKTPYKKGSVCKVWKFKEL